MRGRDRPGSAGGRGAGHARRYGNRGDAVRDHTVRGPHRRPAGVAARRRGNREGDRGPAGRVTGGRELPRRDVGARRRDALRVLLRLRGRDDLGRDGPDPEALSGAGDRGPVSDETLLTSLTDGVARITLNRPEVRNALSRTMVAELEAALASFEADPAARVVVLAVGCDIVIASEDATFGLPEITLGLLPLIVMAPVLRAAGTKRGLPFVLSAENISAREALDIGLVSRVVPRAELESATTALARRVAGWSPTAVAIAKEAASTIQDME